MRLYWLERLIDEAYDGSPKVLQDKTGIKMAQVNQWFSGYRSLREKALRGLEVKTQKDRGWFDRPPPTRPSAETWVSLTGVADRADGGAAEPPAQDELLHALEIVARAVGAVEPEVRAAFWTNFALLANPPRRGGTTAQAIVNLLSPSSSQSAPKVLSDPPSDVWTETLDKPTEEARKKQHGESGRTEKHDGQPNSDRVVGGSSSKG